MGLDSRTDCHVCIFLAKMIIFLVAQSEKERMVLNAEVNKGTCCYWQKGKRRTCYWLKRLDCIFENPRVCEVYAKG